jgi:polar amino acid transport system substrate-binding protein
MKSFLQRSRIKSAAFLTVLTIVGTAVTACGSSEPSTSSDGFKLVKSGELTYSMSGDFRPFNFYDENNKLTGFDVEIGEAIADKLGLKPNPVTGTFDALIAGLNAKKSDLIIGSMSPTDERKKKVNFSANYYESGARLFVKKGSPIAALTDLGEGDTVGVTKGTTFAEYAEKQPGVKVVTYPSDQLALRDLPNGRVDAVITTDLVGLYLIKQAKLDAQSAGPALYSDPAAIASRKDNPKLTARVDEILAELKTDGTYGKISTKWFGTSTPGGTE